jgi:small conductance mechanosensitive channel
MRFFRRPNPVAAPRAMRGAAAQVREQASKARRARRQVVVAAPLLAGVLVLYDLRKTLFGTDIPVRVVCAIALVALGWWLARDIGRSLAPILFRRLDPSTAGPVSFLIRLVLVLVALAVALRIAGLQPGDLAVGGAFTAVILGIAAQNTLGNVFSGLILLSARPFRVGERVRLQAGAVAGRLEGVVSSLGLLYVTLAEGEDVFMVPNSVVMNSAIVPLREPASIDLRARLRPDVKPSELQAYLEEAVTVRTRSRPRISVEELDDEEVVMRIAATPELDRDGPKLADEILAAVGRVAGRAEAAVPSA